ncbi:MAG: signal peptide peptidase SppA [Geobacteraceae bacterium]
MSKNRWLWLALAVGGGIVFLFVISVFTIGVLLGENQGLISGGDIGIVEVKGVILDSEETVKQLHDFGKNEGIKVVVLRIDSPGGVVGPSQEIYAEVKKLAVRKPVLVSMGSVAASGGYYIAAPATLIFANPGTITGSIGVILKLSNVEKLMDKVGMKVFTLKTGKYKDTGSPVRPMTKKERQLLQGVIDTTHGQFVRAVAEGRKLPLEEVRRIADGRVLSGEQAMSLKLVDRLGSLQDAIEEAGRLAGVKGEPRLVRPPRKKRFLLDMLVEETAAGISSIVRQETGFSVNYEMEGMSRSSR